jgi:hypothetical protein
MLSACAVGLSGAIFALVVVDTHFSGAQARHSSLTLTLYTQHSVAPVRQLLLAAAPRGAARRRCTRARPACLGRRDGARSRLTRFRCCIGPAGVRRAWPRICECRECRAGERAPRP